MYQINTLYTLNIHNAICHMYLFLKIIYLLIFVVLGLYCFVWAFSGYREWGLLLGLEPWL